MKRLLFTAVFCITTMLAVAFSYAQQNASAVPENTGSKVSQKEAQQALDFHNAKRTEVGAPPLQWSPEIAAHAQQWAEHLATEYKCKRLQNDPHDQYGQNVFSGSGAFFSSLSASQSWYGESKTYTPGVLTSENWDKASHYTQMVWSKTQRIGMGQANCGMGTVIVAEYDPPGNMMGEKPY